ncbi:MAG: hypothetical protein LUQ65_06195, partial [Candidatus Helarchaeota archaeon]|nr:hypothetical protein [Candidatus Helarchaeota archaeon]
KDNVWEFLTEWETQFPRFKEDPRKIPDSLLDKPLKRYYITHHFVPHLKNLKDASKIEKEKIIELQKQMRKEVRGWFGSLG